jgi:tetratricopeptide (TPR) repeat protein
MRRSMVYAAALIVCGALAGLVYKDSDYTACKGIDYPTVVSSCTRLADSAALSNAIRASALVNRGRAEARQNRDDAALADYDRALDLNPAYHRAYYMKAAVLFDKGRRDEALTLLDTAIDLRPPYHHAHELRGWLHKESGDYWKAALDYAEAVRMAPHGTDMRNTYEWIVWRAAEAHRKEAKPFDADRLIASLPNDGFGYMARARTAHTSREQTLADVDRAIALGYRDAELLLWRSKVRQAKGDDTGAIADVLAAHDLGEKKLATKDDTTGSRR